MAQRVRRPNAGNRLQALISEQVPLSEADAEFFAERDDDEDFDLEAEEERIRQERLAAERAETSENGDKSSEEGSESDSNGEHDDSNFSDTSDDSESDRDDMPPDAGEKQLQTEERQRSKDKRKVERDKMFKIKQRPPPRSENDPPKEPRKKPVFSSVDLLLEQGRHSERASAMRNKQQLIEQMREAEKRRAQYVPPKQKKVHKLTQEERLEEAKKTEAKNLSSLNKFVELEEERKFQQRLAMISKRPRLTHFVRFHSSQHWEAPKLIEVQDHADIAKEETESEAPRQAGDDSQVEVKAEPQGGASLPTLSPTHSTEISTHFTGLPTQNASQVPTQNASQISSQIPMPPVTTEGSADLTSAQPDDVKEDEVDDNPPVQGPARLKTYNFLTLHEFQAIHINRYSIRSIILGPVASTIQQPPHKRMCPFTGRPARYLDPYTNVAYTDLPTNKLIKLARENKLGWSRELGGVFTSDGMPQRHAKGVPEGFA